MAKHTYRLLPEWAPQAGIQLTWPRPDGDWADILERIEATLERIILATVPFQRVLISVGDHATQQRLAKQLAGYGVTEAQREIIVAPSDDTWARDHGPLTVANSLGECRLLDYRFTGWGGKFPADADNRLTRALGLQGVWQCPVISHSLVLEGGALETDGEGTLLTTEACLLNPNRNPDWSRDDIEAQLGHDLGIERFLWLSNGYLEGDDTDSHIDTLARFCDASTIAYVQCTDTADPHYAALRAMEQELKAFRQRNGAPYRLIALPWPRRALDPEDGHRLPATYANFLIINGAVLVPTYGDPADLQALQQLAKAFPSRCIIPIECSSVIRQHGSLHCLTMQLPEGTLTASNAIKERSCPTH